MKALITNQPKIPDTLLGKDRTPIYVPRALTHWAKPLMEPNQRTWVFWTDIIVRGLASKAEEQAASAKAATH